jgi:bifunctional UDP-N-acetylglucosamine pyrophosphorylase/glucosamine-1-phosphate N-acetyltransferase
MLAHLADRYLSHATTMVAVVHPAARAAVTALAATLPLPVVLMEQAEPTGMLDAVLIGLRAPVPPAAERYWITWCDQVSVLPDTLERLGVAERAPGAELVMPVVRQADPYIHFDRDSSDRIVAVRQRREGDDMPAVGEGDMGLFSLSPRAAELLSSAYAPSVAIGAGTGERNFLPFVPWAAGRIGVVTIPATDPMEAKGINTPEELAVVERFLKERSGC